MSNVATQTELRPALLVVFGEKNYRQKVWKIFLDVDFLFLSPQIRSWIRHRNRTNRTLLPLRRTKNSNYSPFIITSFFGSTQNITNKHKEKTLYFKSIEKNTCNPFAKPLY